MRKPFQVIHSENSWRHDSTNLLSNLDLPRRTDTIYVGRKGYLILAHFSGYLYEFEEGSTISIEELAIEVNRQLSIKTANLRVHYSQLFSINKFRYPISPGGGGNICGPSVITIKFRDTHGVIISDSTPEWCFHWHNEGNDEVAKVRLKNIFDETLFEYGIDDTVIRVDLKKFARGSGGVLIIEFSGKRTDKRGRISEYSIETFGIELGEQTMYVPNVCEVDTSIEALELAFYYENLWLYTDALSHYQLATQFSDREIFKTILAKYESRVGVN